MTFTLPEVRDQAIIEITETLNDFLEQARSDHPNIAFYKSGDIILNHTLSVATEDDFLVLAPFAFAVVVIASLLILRSILGTLAIITINFCHIRGHHGLCGLD